MRVLHLNAGAEKGGGMVHILSLLSMLNYEEFYLGLFEKGTMFEKAKELNIHVELFNQSSRYDLSILKKMVQFIEENEIDIVHTHGPRANFYAYFLKRSAKRCLFVTTVHSDPRDDFLEGSIKGKVFTKLNLLSLKSMDHYFAISNRFKEMLVGFGIDESRISTIYNGINFKVPSSRAKTRNELGLDAGNFVIIMVARLHPVKNHILVFQVLKFLLNFHPNLRLMLIGDGPIKEKLEEKAYQLSINDKVLFLGYQKDVHSLLQMSDVKLLNSFSESFPLVILEASRARVPVISTDVGGVTELISDPTLGWVISVNDKESLIKAISEAITLKEQGKLKRLGENLYNKAKDKYSLERLRDEVYNTYKQLLTNNC